MSVSGVTLHPYHPSHVSAESHLGNPLFPRERSHADQVAMDASPRSSSKHHTKKTADYSDTASVSSFGSSISLLKNKFRSSSSTSTKKQQDKEKRNVLRNQVNIVG